MILCMLISLLSFNASAKDFTYDEMADFLSKLDILHGDASKGGDYDYYSYLTRAQFAKIAVASSSFKNSVPTATNTSPYSDVSRYHWAAGYVKVASQNKLISGYPDSTFRPENNVLLEEAVTIALKLLGYENSDFGGEWPYGQMGIANNIGLLDNVTVSQGMAMTRLDAIALMFNTLNADTKQGTNYLQSIGYERKEEVVLVSSYYQDPSIDSNKVVTSEGTYKINDNFDFSEVGRKGDLLLKNNKEILGFYPDGQAKEVYVVMGVLGNDIIISANGSSEILDLSDDTVAYYNSTKTTYSALASKVSTGDSISVIKDNNGMVKYVALETQAMEGPITVTSRDFLSSLSINQNEATIIKGGNVVSISDVDINDIAYYSKVLNTVWVYDDQRVGIYEQAIPNQEFPTSVVISGTTYELESANAFSKLSSTGNFKLGSSVTLLLGKDGKIADVISTGASNEEIYGYVLSVGSKEYTIDNQKYTSNYINIASTDGNTYEYTCDRNYESYRSKIVKITFTDSGAKATMINTNGFSGTFDASNYTFGSNKLAKNVSIIDVKETDVTEEGSYIKVYPTRLDGINIKSSEVLYYEKNSSGEITGLILSDVTGDAYEYGIILTASEKGGTTYITNGAKTTVGTYFTANSRTPAKLDLKNNRLDGFYALNSVGTVKSLTNSHVINNSGEKFTLSDKVEIYTVTGDFDYMLTTLSDAIKNISKYSVSAYYDKSDAAGGRVRVIILR